MSRQRQTGIEAISGSPVTLRPNAKSLPKLTCSKCGKIFYYRGIQDADSVAGTTYDPTSGEFVPSGSTPAVCDECKRKMTGGPYSGKTVGDLY